MLDEACAPRRPAFEVEATEVTASAEGTVPSETPPKPRAALDRPIRHFEGQWCADVNVAFCTGSAGHAMPHRSALMIGATKTCPRASEGIGSQRDAARDQRRDGT